MALAPVAALLLAGAPPALAAPPTGAASARLTGDLLVLLDTRRAGTASAGREVVAGIASVHARIERSVPQIGLLVVRPPAAAGLAGFAARLRGAPGVASVQPERRYVPRSVAPGAGGPDDPALTEIDPAEGVAYQWYLNAEGFPGAWALTQGQRALVGVIDTGVDATHPELAPKLAATVDQQDASSARGTARSDEVGHGTHVASLACAATDNAIGIAGAGYGCRLVSEKSDFSDSSIAAAIVDAADRGVLALNMSFGPADPATSGPAPDSEVRALAYAAARRVVLVAAAADSPGSEQGDPGNVLQPAGTGPHLEAGLGLDVTAAQHDGRRATFAGSGSEISLAAYGAFDGSSPPGGSPTGGVACQGVPAGILAAYPAAPTDLEQFPPAACRTTFDGDRSYAYLAGTSMAAPQVAGAAALLRALNPYATLADVLRALKETAQRPAGSGWSSDLGWGILDAGAAVQAIRRVDRLAPVAYLRAPSRTRAALITVRWGGHDQERSGLIASGIAAYELYVAAGGGRARLLLRTTRHSLVFRGRPGGRYSFSVRAVDRAGNRTSRPARASTRVAPAR